MRSDLTELVERPVPYDEAPELTGYARGSLENRKDLRNVGTRKDPAFRLGSLPVKRVERAPSAAYLLHQQLERLQTKETTSPAERRVREMARKASRN